MKKLLNQFGFSLAEGMVTAGLLGIVSLAMLQGLKQDSKTKSLARIEDDIQAVMATINASIKDNVACTNTLRNMTINSSLSALPGGAIKSPANVNLTSPVTNFTSVPLQVSTTAEVAPGLLISNIQVGRYINYFTLNDNFSTTGSATTKSYGAAEVTITFSMRPSSDKDATSAPVRIQTVRSILVNVERNTANMITNCINPADLTALQLKKQICAKSGIRGSYMVGSFDPSTGNCSGIESSLKSMGSQIICEELGGYVNASGNCVPVGTTDPLCPNGIQSFDSNGKAVCY